MIRSVRDELARVVGFREDRRRAHPPRDLIRRPHATQEHDPWRPLSPCAGTPRRTDRRACPGPRSKSRTTTSLATAARVSGSSSTISTWGLSFTGSRRVTTRRDSIQISVQEIRDGIAQPRHRVADRLPATRSLIREPVGVSSRRGSPSDRRPSSCSGGTARAIATPPRRSSRRSFRTGARQKRRGTWVSSNAGAADHGLAFSMEGSAQTHRR